MFPSLEDPTLLSSFSPEQLELFETRFENGYDIFYTDAAYVTWLQEHHPDSVANLSTANMFTEIAPLTCTPSGEDLYSKWRSVLQAEKMPQGKGQIKTLMVLCLQPYKVPWSFKTVFLHSYSQRLEAIIHPHHP